MKAIIILNALYNITESHDIPGLLMVIDFAKAFDSLILDQGLNVGLKSLPQILNVL